MVQFVLLNINPLIVFRLIDKNYKLGYPYADMVMFKLL